MPEKKIEAQYHRSLAIQCLRVISEESRRVELSFSSEEPYQRWFGTEILCHDTDCVNLARLCEVGALLFSHGRDPNVGRIPIGRIIEATLDSENHRTKAVVEFDGDEKSDLIYTKVKSGAIRGVSTGYHIDLAEEVSANKKSANGRFCGPCVVAARWSPFEISIEPTPADPSIGIGRSNDPDYQKGEILQMLNSNTNPQERATTPGAEIPVPPAPQSTPTSPPDNSGFRAEGAASERQRIVEITAMCRDFDLDATEHIEKGSSAEEVRAAILAGIRTEKTGQKALSAQSVRVVADEEDRFRTAARDGQLLRMGLPPEKPAQGAAEFRGMSLRSLAVNCLVRGGGASSEIISLSDDELLKAVYGLSRDVAQPDSAFTAIINNTMGAALSGGYSTANTTFQLWTGKGSNPNFKTSKRYRISASGEPEEIKQGGEFKADRTSDEGVDTKLKTYGKKFSFTRQMFIDDDLGVVARSIQAHTRSFKRAINKQVYQFLGENAKYSLDNKALFSVEHKNLGTAGALSVATLGELMKRMLLQTDLSGKAQLNVVPRFGLFPVSLMLEANRILYSESDPTAANSGVKNPVRGLVTPIFDAELDRYSATAHYVAAAPGDVDTIEVSYYNGKEEPTLESRLSWESLGIEYRMFHDWTVSLNDWRGLAANFGK